jgi:hypothetical protein
MQAPCTGSRLALLGPTLWWGIPLGLLQVGIILNGFFFTIMQLGWTPSIALGALFYLVIPAIAGFFTARRHREGAFTGRSLGWKIGACSLLVVIFFALVIVVAYLLTLPHAASGSIGSRFSPLEIALLLGTLFFALIVLNSFGLLLGLVGGFFGGWLGRRTIRMSRHSAFCA